MELSRRKFIQLCTAGLAAVGISQSYVGQVAEAFAKSVAGEMPIIWLQGAGCNGCSASLLHSVHPDYRELLTSIINLHYHPHLMAEESDNLIERLRKLAREKEGKFILVVEGALPQAAGGMVNVVGEDASGKAVPFVSLVKELGGKADTVIAVGTCAAFGGVAAAAPNPSDCVGINNLVSFRRVMNISGCPPHPDWIVGSLAHLLLYKELPELDDFGRAKMFYGGVIHDNCPRRQYFDNSKFARNFSEPGCLLEIGCRGPMAYADCSVRLYNNGVNWCIKSGAPCLSCTHPNFPDGVSPFYSRMPIIEFGGITATADTFGKVAVTATILGLGAHLTGNILAGRVGNFKKLAKEKKVKAKKAKDGEEA